MEKVLLALGFRQVEEYLRQLLNKEFIFCGATVYREGIIPAITKNNPDVVVILETLDGHTDIMDIVYEITQKFPQTRIVFVAKERQPGDALLASLVNYRVYDILHDSKIHVDEIARLIRTPNEYKDVRHLQPKPVYNEKKNKMLFEAPDIPVEEKVVVQTKEVEVYVDNQPNKKEGPTKESKEDIQRQEHTKENSTIPVQKINPIQEPKEKKTLKETNEMEKPVSLEDKEEKENTKKSVLPFFSKKTEKTEEAEETEEEWKRKKSWLKNTLTSTTTQKTNKIISFIGSRGGVGNTTIAFNTALHLANQKHDVLYVEMSKFAPSVNYLYNIGHPSKGIDSALRYLEEKKIEKVNEAITCSLDLKEDEDNPFFKNFKQFPDGLDFIFYSEDFISGRKQVELPKHMYKELFFYFLFQLEYDYIILDLPVYYKTEEVRDALLYSNHIFSTITQDVASIGQSVTFLRELMQKGVDVKQKCKVVVNKWEKTDLKLREIEEWYADSLFNEALLEKDFFIQVPNTYKESINANRLGIPLLLYKKNALIKDAVDKIEHIIYS